MIPRLSHLQCLVLASLGGRERAGREVRKALDAKGHRSSSQAFYQAMSRLEDDGLIEGRSEQVEVEDHRGQKRLVTERRYKLLGAGATAYNEQARFYRSLPGALEGSGEF